MKKSIMALALALPLSLFAQTSNCGDTDAMFKILQEKYGERIVLVGRTEKGSDVVVSIWFNPKENTGTIIKSSLKDKRSCAVETLEEAKIVNNSQSVNSNPNINKYTH